VTSGINERPYLSIGEVLGLLLEEFPDVTISKIRFLESQGLIEPERTASGYRKFFDADIERLKVILREQRENFLPLRVIRDRLETGAIDDSGAITAPSLAGTDDTAAVPVPTAPTASAAGSAAPGAPAAPSAPADNVSQLHQPRGIRNVRVGGDSGVTGALDLDDTGPMGRGADDTGGYLLDDPTGTISPHADQVNTNRHPAAQGRPSAAAENAGDHTTSMRLLAAVGPSDVYDRSELCSLVGITQPQLAELESYGLVAGRGTGSTATFTEGDLAVARAAAGFLARGIDARHLRSWRQSAEREAGLFEQRILPLLRQRNPHARQEALQLLGELADLGAELREALVVSMLKHHLDS
jgi:DNA-binding transcriptional MerR regulator